MSAEVRFDEATRLATLSIVADPAAMNEAPPTSANAARVHVEIAAQVGRDRRFSAAEAVEEATP